MGFGEPQAGMHSWTLPYEESQKIIKHALDQGINFFDTAICVGSVINYCDALTALSEIYRVLKHDSYLIFRI